MNKDKALKLALEALEICEQDGYIPVRLTRESITAIKEALAQPEQEFESTCSETLRAQGKPYPHTCKKCGLGPCIGKPQREWQSLTDEQIDQGLLRSDYALQTAHAWRAGVVFAMTQLKEKNT